MDCLDLLSNIPYDDIVKMSKDKLKKPRFIIHGYMVRIGELLNSFGNYTSFIEAINSREEDLHIYKILADEGEDNLHICLVGKINMGPFIKKYWKWWKAYFKHRKDLILFKRIYITFKKSWKYVYRYNYNTCIDLNDYFKSPEKYNQKIIDLFLNKEIDRLNLYRYTIIEKIFYHNSI